jgi:hypothetical protein
MLLYNWRLRTPNRLDKSLGNITSQLLKKDPPFEGGHRSVGGSKFGLELVNILDTHDIGIGSELARDIVAAAAIQLAVRDMAIDE